MRPEQGKAAVPDPLHRYRTKRDFGKTPEPQDAPAKHGEELSFVIQKHAATRLHYDFRLELGGVLLSWAVPKGPSFDPTDKRMAVRTEDHPLSYGAFEGTIPPGNYGAGTVIVWDHGTWTPIGNEDARPCCGVEGARDGIGVARRALLERLLKGKTSEHLRFSETFAADAASVLRSACEMHLEGVIAKRTDAPYRSERSETWLKLKCHRRQEFVVGGFTDRAGASAEVGSLPTAPFDAAGSGGKSRGPRSRSPPRLRRRQGRRQRRRQRNPP